MYLVVITRKRNVGSLLGHAVWKAADFDVISYKKTVLHLSEIQVSKSRSLILKEMQTCCGKLKSIRRTLVCSNHPACSVFFSCVSEINPHTAGDAALLL